MSVIIFNPNRGQYISRDRIQTSPNTENGNTSRRPRVSQRVEIKSECLNTSFLPRDIIEAGTTEPLFLRSDKKKHSNMAEVETAPVESRARRIVYCGGEFVDAPHSSQMRTSGVLIMLVASLLVAPRGKGN